MASVEQSIEDQVEERDNQLEAAGEQLHAEQAGRKADEDLAAYYRTASVYISLSEHEGFCVPLLEAMAADNGWNREFVQRVTGTSGLYSAQGEAMRSKYESGELKQEDLSLELWTTSVLQFDEDTGAAGIYCTTFSPHVKPQGETTEADYAHHYLLDFAHRDPPFILARREVTGPGMFDSRSVPDITTSNSQVIRNLQKAGLARAHLEVDPPRAFLGFGGSQIADWNKPGAKVSSIASTASHNAAITSIATTGDSAPKKIGVLETRVLAPSTAKWSEIGVTADQADTFGLQFLAVSVAVL